MNVPPEDRVSVRQVLAVREFRALLASSALSVTGDQIARVAVAVLVYQRTDSAFFSAASIACSYLTWLVGGPFLSALADRWPRRRLMVLCDLSRAVLVMLLVVPHVPLWVLFAVLLLVGVLAPPFDSAKSSILPEVLPGERYMVGNALQSSLLQASSLIGFLLGGALVALLSPQGALAIDAGTFVASAALIGLVVHEHPQPPREPSSLLGDAVDGVRLVASNPALRRPLYFGILGAIIMIAPEGLAVPIAISLGGGSMLAGVLIAALPIGFVLGSALLLRFPGPRRDRLLTGLTAFACLPLLFSPFVTNVPALVALWALSGVGAAGQLIANGQFMTTAHPGTRGRAFGVAALTLNVTSGLVLVSIGALAELVDARTAVAAAGAATLALLLPLVLTGRARAARPVAAPIVPVPEMAAPAAPALIDLTDLVPRTRSPGRDWGRADVPDFHRPRLALGRLERHLELAHSRTSDGRGTA